MPCSLAYAPGSASGSHSWDLFAKAFSAPVDTPEARAEAAAMAAAASRARAEIAEIERTCRPPKDDLGFLPNGSATERACS